MPNGIPSPKSGELVLEVDMKISNIYDIGKTQFGRRHVNVIENGTATGPKISAVVLNGGLDYQLTLSNGTMEIDQINVMRTSDGNYIYLRT